jgi:hypothetical protein
MRSLDPGTARHERRGLVGIAANLTVSFRTRNEPLTALVYARRRGDEEPDMRVIVALIGALTVLALVLPVHP